MMMVSMSTTTVWDRAKWESSPALRPWIWAFGIPVLSITTVAEKGVVRALLFHAGDEVPEGTGLVVVAD
jgi:hypothetical protein